MAYKNNDFHFEIVEQIGVIAERTSGWKLEINRMSWNDKPAKYDIREWDEKHDRMGRGTTLTEDEARTLYEILKARFEA